MRLIRRCFRRFRATRVFQQLLTLVLCYCFILQPSLIFATPHTTSLPGQTMGAGPFPAGMNEITLGAALTSLNAVVGKFGDFISTVLPSPPPPVPPLGDAAVSRKIPTLSNGRVAGNLRVYTGESFSFEGGFVVTDETYVVGTPTVTVATNATYHGSVVESGSALPSGYTVAINGTSRLVGQLHLHTDALGFPASIPQSVPQPAGTRVVNINTSSDLNNIGNWSTLKELHVNKSGETITVPPGNYGAFSVAGNSRLNFSSGTYNFTDGFTFASNASIKVTGKTVINVGSSANISNTGILLGDNTLSGDVKLNVLGSLLVITGNSTIKALVRVPNGTAQISGASVVHGQVLADTLQIVTNGAVEGDTASSGPADTTVPTVNITSPANNSSTAATSITVSGSAADSGTNASDIFQVTVNNAPANYNVSDGTWTIANVPLAPGSNTITARAIDNAGNLATPQSITVIRQTADTTPPTIAFSSPANNFTTEATSFTATVTAADAGPNASGVASVVVGGVPANFNSTSGVWTADNVPLPSIGANTILATATDAAGNVSTPPASITVIRQQPQDTTRPTVTISLPANNSSTELETTSVSGSAADVGVNASGVSQVTVNGLSADFNAGTGTWTISNVPLPNIGPNQIVATARDVAGNESAPPASITITRQQPADTTPPTLLFTSPAEGSSTPSESITITGSASDSGQYPSGVAHVFVNNASAVLDPQIGNWSIANVSLVVGPNTIEAYAVDQANNHSATQTLHITRQAPADTVSPTLTITSPANDSTTPDASITVTGTAIDQGPYATGVRQVLVNGQPAAYDPVTHQWTATGVSLNEGSNTIRVFADDNAAAPNPAETSINVFRRTPDTQAPTVTISSPVASFETYDASLTVSGTARDEGLNASGVQSVTVNGVQASYDAVTGQWSVTNIPLAYGDNDIVVTATDSAPASNQGHANVHGTRLRIPPPELSARSPQNGAVLAATSITVAGSVSSLGTTPTVTVNGQNAIVSGGQFAIAVALQEGANAITVVATDSLAQQTQVSLSLIRDTTAPAVTFTNVPATVQPGGTYQILADASDNLGIADVQFSLNGQPVATATTAPYQFTLTVPIVSAAGTSLVLSAVARDLTNTTAVATAQTQIGGPSGISGYVFDDSTGYILPGVTAQLNSDGPVVTDDTGAFNLVSSTPSGVVRLIKDGHTPVERLYSVAIGEGTALFDARLTPLDPHANLIGVAGGTASGDGGRLQVSFPAGAFNQAVDVRVTGVSPQGLANLLPYGWSPVPGAVVDVRPAVVAPTQAFSSAAHLTISPVAALSSATPLALARYDEVSHRWMVVATGVFATAANGGVGDGSLSADLSGSGQYAYLVADTGATAPPAAVVGQPLTTAQPAESAALDSAQASAVATPRSATFSASARSAISFFATAPTQLPSGVSIEATFGETYNLLGGRDSLLVDRPAQDFVLYAYPAVSDQPNRLGAFFIAKPTRTDFTITELFNANVHVEIRSGRQTRLGALIDGNGGVVRASDGSQLTIPVNAFSGPQSVFFNDIAPQLANVSLPSGYEIVGAFDLDLGSITLNSSATISVPGISGDLSRIVVARLITVGGQRSPKVVARATADTGGKLNSTIASPPLPAGVQLSGIRTSGRYLFIRVPQPFGYVKGTVTDASNSNPAAMTKISDNQTPFVDVTGSDGEFVVIGSAGANALGVNQISAASLATDATGNANASLSAQDAVTNANISVSAVPLQVESITPALNAQDMIATTPVTVTFNKPVSAQSVTGSSFTLSTASGNPVLGSITVLAGNRVVVFTPGATLAAATNYRVSLSQSIRDSYGHQLGASFNSTFTTATAVAVSNRLRPEQISIGYPNANGTSTISIPAGSVPTGATILVVNMTNGATITTVAGSGAITLSIPASVGDEIVLTIRQADGTEYTVTQSAYRRADGFVSVGANGGTVTSEDGSIVLAIPSGAVNGQANIKLTPKGEDAITIPREGAMDPANVGFGAGVEIKADGDFTLLKEVHLELPAPPGTPEGKRMAFMKPTRVTVEGQEIDAWETVTSGTVINGKFRTSSPPFFGAWFGSGVIVQIFALMPTLGRVAFGWVKELEYDEANKLVPGVLVLLGDYNSNYYGHVVGHTNSQGYYALFDFSVSTQNAAPVKALDVQTGRTAVGTAVTQETLEEDFFQGVSGFQTLRANLLLPHFNPHGTGEAPATIRVFGVSSSLPLDQDPLFSRGVVTVPQPVLIVAHSNRALAQINGTALVGGAETRQLTWQEQAPDPDGSHTYIASLTANAEGSYLIKVNGTTQIGNQASSTAVSYNFIGLRNPNTRPPLPEPPSVIHITPADNAENVDLATDIRVEFSEPVHNLVPGQTVYVQEDGKPEKIGGTILSGGTIVQPDTPAISSIVFKPTSSLTANKKYFVYVTNEVRDDTNDGLDQQYNGQGDTTRDPFSSSFQTFGGMVITPQPITESATRIAVAGTYALAMQSDQSGRSRVNIYDISSPSTPTVSGSFYVPQRAFDIAVTDSEADSLKVDGRVHTRLAAVVTYSPLHQEQWANIWFVNWDEVTAPEIVGVTSIFLPLDVPSTPLSVQFHQGRAYIGNVPYQGVNVVDVAQSIHLFNEGLARGKNPVVDAVRPETGQQFAGFGQSARVQTATLRESVALDATGTAPSIATLDLGRPVVFIANSFPRRLGVLQFPLLGDGFNIALGDTSQVHDPRIVGAFPVVPNDSEPRLVKAIEDVSVQGGQRVPLVLLMGAGRLWIFNVQDPSHPAQYPSKSWVELGLTGTARWFDVEGTLAYVAIDNDVAVIDFADPANPRLVEKLTGVGSHLSALAVKDGFIYSLSPGSDGQDGLSVAIASPASRLFIYGASADPSTVCGNPIIVDRNTHKMRQAAGFYFEVFGHRPPGTEQITIRKGEQIITTVTATILPTSTDLITIGRAEWNTGEDIDRAATYTAELTLDENAANEFHSRREVIPFSYLLENYNESMTLPIEGSTAQSNEKFPYAFVLGTNANVTLTVNGNVVLNGPRSFGLHVEPLAFTGMAEGRYPFTLRAEAQGDPSIADQISGVLTIQRNIANARPPGHTVVGGVDIASGNLGLSQGDVPEIANRGLALSFTRSYNTALANSFGPLGYGWQHNFQVLLTSVRSGNAVTYSLRGGDGSGQSFKATTPTGAVLMAAEKPYHGSLQRNSDGSFDYYTKARIRYHFPGAYEVNSFNFYDQSYMGNLEFMEEPDGNRLTLVYDSLGRMISVTDSSNRALQFEYQEGASPFAGVISTANATRTEQSCVPRGQLSLLRQRFVKAQGGVAWRIMSIKGPGGLAVEYGYDASGNLNRVTRKGSDSISAGTADEVWQYDYKPTPVPLPAADLTHFLKSVTNPNGHATNYDYWFDQLGLPVKTMAQPENASLNFSYVLDQNNLIKQTTTIDGRGNPTVYTLSVDGYTTALTAPRGAHSTFEYNDSGLKTRETDPLGMITTYEYDAKGNLRKRTSAGVDGVSVSSEVLYDQTYSRPLSQRDQNGNVTGFTLDGHGKTTQVRQPNGSVKQFDYAPNGDLLRVTDERGLHTQISYDAYGNASHVERETQAGRSIVTDNTYDVRSRLVSMTDTLQPSITRAYDALDRLKTEVSTDPGDFRDQLTSAYEYTPLGQTLSTTMSGNGQTRTQNYEYDNLERVSKLHEGGNGVAGPLTRTFTYDGNSNVLSVTDRRGVVTSYEYDALNYQTSVRLSGPFGPDIAVKTVTPDLVGNPLTIVDQYADTTTFDYDGLHRLVKRTLPGNYTEEQGLDPNGNVISTKDRNGRITTILYDALNRPVMRRDPGGRVQTWTFTDSTGTVVTNWSPQNITITEQADTIGRALRRVTAFGSNQYTTTISYTGRSRTTVDARGTSSTEQLSAFGEVGAFEIQTGTQTLRARMHYAALGGLKTTTDASDRTSTFTLDGLNRRTSASHQGGFSESWTYDGEGLRLSYTNKRGVTFSTTYDNQERQLTTSAQGFSETIPIASISYDDSHHKEIRTDGENHASSYTFDALHRVVSLTNADTQTRSFQYDGINLIRESNFRNQSTEYTYDSLNRVTQIKDPLNQVTIIGHSDLGGYTQTVTDRRGNTCVKAYDQLDRLTGVIEGGEALVTYEYDANNNRVAMIDGLSNRTAYTYDELNRVKTISHANLQTETYTYDNAGNVIAYNDGHGPSVTQEYDALDHLHKRTDGAGNTTEFRADGEGLLLEKIEPKSALHKTTYEYNALGSLKRVIDAGGGPWQLSYDRKQNLKSVTDARQNTTNYDYDALDRLTTVQQPHSLTTTYGYDADGNRTLIRDPKGQEFSLTYDALNRLKVRNFASADGSREDKYEYGYDPETNLTSVQNTRRQNAQVVTRSYALTYDARDRLTTATDAFGKTVSYQYDAANNLRNFTDAAGRPTAYTYDAHNRLQTATLTGSREAHYDWFADGLLQRVSYGAGLQREYAYDDADRMSRITNTVGVDGPQSQTEVFEYGYDGNSNRETETRKLNGQITRTAHYNYDQLDRLTQAAYDRPGATPAANTLTYGYDAAGNRVSENGTTAAGTAVARTFVNDELNRLTRVVDNGTIHDYEYDNNGNLTALKQDDGQLINSYEYDAWDQLRVVRSGPQRQEVARYDYDYARRRTSKALGGSSSEQRFVYNASAVVDEYDEQNHLLNRYDYGTEVIRGEFAGEGERFYFSDSLGSTTSLSQITQSGQASFSSVTASYEYDAWGNTERFDGNSFNQLGYTGQRFDAETNMWALGNGERYYSAGLGRFIQQDSLSGSNSQPQSLNRYAYTTNNPLRYTDPTGHTIEEGTQNQTQKGYVPPKMDMGWRDWLQVAWTLNQGIQESLLQPFKLAMDSANLPSTLAKAVITWKRPDPEDFYSNVFKGAAKEFKEHKPITEIIGNTAKGMLFNAITLGIGPWIVDEVHLAQDYTQGKISREQYDDASIRRTGNLIGDDLLIVLTEVALRAAPVRGAPRIAEESSFSAGMETPRLFEDPAGISRPSEGLQKVGASEAAAVREAPAGGLGGTVDIGETGVEFGKGIKGQGTGSFSVVDWTGYPKGVPRPEGPFRLIEGVEYETARDAANKANSAIRRQQDLIGKPVDVHEIQPVKFGGSPTDPSNKVVLPRALHRREVTPWWNQLQRDLQGP